MSRKLSDESQDIYWALWLAQWGCAADIARMTGLKDNAVSTALSRGEKRGWLKSVLLGRSSKSVLRYVLTDEGIAELRARYGWVPFWWHTAAGVKALARRLEVLEIAYRYLPDLWRSNAVSRPSVYVYEDRPRIIAAGEQVLDAELVERDWSGANLVELYWLKKGPFEAIAIYGNGRPGEYLYLPILWRGDFQKPKDIAWVRRQMREVLAEDERWYRLPQDQALGDYYPGMVILCPGRVSAAMVQRNWRESLTRREHVAIPAIIDAQGQVVRAMTPPTALWKGYRPPPRGEGLGDIRRAVASLGKGAYAAVNGLRSWRAFRAIDGSPGITQGQISNAVGVDTTVAGLLLAPMIKSKVLRSVAGGYYLEASGRGLLADSQRRSRHGVKRRWGVYATRGGEYVRGQRLHNQGQVEVILAVRRHGFPAFPAMGVVIDYWHQGRLVRVAPDGFVILPPGVLVAFEFERSARTPRALLRKAEKYQRLWAVGVPLPVLFIMDTDPGRGRNRLSDEERRNLSVAAARNLAELRHPYLLATDLQSVQEGPHGQAIFEGSVLRTGSDSGCWWYWYRDRDNPSSHVPIDLWSQMYVQNDQNKLWRIPVDNPWRMRIDRP